MTQSIHERLQMTHLSDPTPIGDLAEEIDKQVESMTRSLLNKPVSDEAAAAEDEKDPRAEKVWTFNFRWEDGNKKVWEGQFQNEILSIGMRGQVAILAAALANGIPFGAFSILDQQLFRARAHLQRSLKKRPKWAESIDALTDQELVLSIYEEVASHEAVFHGHPTPQELREA